MNVRHVIWASIVSTTISCQSVKKEYNSGSADFPGW